MEKNAFVKPPTIISYDIKTLNEITRLQCGHFHRISYSLHIEVEGVVKLSVTNKFKVSVAEMKKIDDPKPNTNMKCRLTR